MSFCIRHQSGSCQSRWKPDLLRADTQSITVSCVNSAFLKPSQKLSKLPLPSLISLNTFANSIILPSKEPPSVQKSCMPFLTNERSAGASKCFAHAAGSTPV